MIRNTIIYLIGIISVGSILFSCKSKNEGNKLIYSDKDSIKVSPITDKSDTITFSYGLYSSDDSSKTITKNGYPRIDKIDTIELNQIFIGKIPISDTEDVVTSIFGNGFKKDTISIVRCKQKELIQKYNFKYISYEQKLNDEGKLWLYSIDLRDTILSFKLPGLTDYTNNISFGDFNRYYPNSYKNRNQGSHWTVSLLNNEKKQFFSYLKIAVKSYGFLTLSFVDGRIFFIELEKNCVYNR